MTSTATLVRCKSSKLSGNLGVRLMKIFLLIGFVFFLIHVLYGDLYCKQYDEIGPLSRASSAGADLEAPTNISHVVLAITGSAKEWRSRAPYIDLWWRRNQTRGFVWLDKFPSNIPPFYISLPSRVSEDTARFKEYDRHKSRPSIRIARMIVETMNLGFEGMRWFVKADDDTALFLDNLVEVLAKYDHNGYYYIGGNSEGVGQNAWNSFNMAFGGGGYAISYPLARWLAKNLDGCIKRYPALYGEDHLMQSCIAELGVSFTREPGFHQMDLRGDLSGFLSAHPQAPVVSLHHLDYIHPTFPSMSRYKALRHLMKAAMVDSSRLLQQVICYDLQTRRSVSISWGYSVYIYEELHPPSILQIPLQTFRAYNKRATPPFMFNVRPLSRDPCAMPHVFYLESVGIANPNQIVTYYTRRTPWKLSSCGNHSARSISQIKVSTPAERRQWGGVRRECCDVKPMPSMNIMEITVRACGENEALVWSHLT